MRFLAYIESDESQPAGPPPPELFAAIEQFGAEMAAKGVVVDQAGLAPTAVSTAVRVEGGTLTVLDGPFAEGKEVIGGYAMYDVRSRDEAIEYSRRFMQIHLDHWPAFTGQCVIRQVFGPEFEEN
jgi:hypothetical protein